jgi:hypothetical protein
MLKWFGMTLQRWHNGNDAFGVREQERGDSGGKLQNSI